MYETELKIAKDIALKAGKIMLEYFDGDQGLEHKDIAGATEVTIADKKINSMVIKELSKHFDDGIIGEEESTSDYGSGRKWICDPIDGTRAFVIGIPSATFSLALVVDGVPIIGVAYDPFLDKLYWATKGQGSFCNGKPLAVSGNKLRGHYVLMPSNPKKIIADTKLINNLLETGARLDSIYGAVYKSCLVARGRAVGYLEKLVNPHDIAAVHVIVEEAGGKVTGYDGRELDYTKPFKGAILSNKVCHDELVRCAV